MKTESPALGLAPKQLWKTKVGYIRLGDVGKSLVHYRSGATPQHRGLRVHVITSERLRKYLLDNEAVLVQE
ncbi:MAG: hypothetical protein L0Z50_26015 [Verrucomicrobiales bacterium]|nr:hypothetical protein [Verrucomicrobiales bacterium]